MPKLSNSIIRRLQLVFSLSTLLLLVSLIASYYSIRQLISNSQMVNHTNRVLVEAENIISFMKDAETGQRGYLLTLDPAFLQPYTNSYQKVADSYTNLRTLTSNDAGQQRNLDRVHTLYEAKYAQMRRVIDMTTRMRNFQRDTVSRHQEMVRGKKVMDDLRSTISQIQRVETDRLQDRLQRQAFYITYTPFLLVVAALISILITAFTYIRIKKDMDSRLAQQRAAEKEYAETTDRITLLEGLTRQIADGDYSVRATDDHDDNLGRIAHALNVMAAALDTTFTDLKNRNWLQTGAVRLSDAIRGEKRLTSLGTRLINAIAEYLRAPLGAIYLIDTEGDYRLAGRYAVQQVPTTVKPAEGLIGQAIEQKKNLIVTDLPDTYSRVSSSLGEATPTALLIVPLLYEGNCVGVIEIGLLRPPTELEISFLNQYQETLAIGVNRALDYTRLQHLLEETQAQSEELQKQHADLEHMNVELEMQTQKLQASEEELRVQQEELQQTNTELEERGLLLEERNSEIQKKADELELATRYKSEFLANMSHELRTPLNSILLLSRLLSENTDHNLTDDQIEYATVINSSGNGLLGLIDEILDLSKIEAGQMKLEYQDINLAGLTDELQALFGVVAKEKGLDFSITTGPGVPAQLHTDRVRLGQILKNLLSNALKFTAQGSVRLTISRSTTQPNTLNFSVIDTGVGIAPEKQGLVFEAFQQADGSTRRKYGGTGLGLSISRELARLLGGEITLTSQPGKGSEFVVQVPTQPVSSALPVSAPIPAIPVVAPPTPPPPRRTDAAYSYISPIIPASVPDDRDNLQPGDKRILIVEDDTHFAKSLLDYARKQGYKGIVAVQGDEGLKLASVYQPLGILLDIQLPVMSGWEVMDALKANPQTRHIPVHIMSSHQLKNESRLKGAVDFVDKPMAFEQMQDVFRKIEHVLNRDSKKVLIIEDNPRHAKALAYFLETFSITSELKSNISEGVDALKRREVDCVILDMGIPDQKAYETLEEARRNPGLENLPIIIFTGKSLSMSEELKIRKYADSIIVKTAHSYQRMLDEVSLFLHLVEAEKPAPDKGASKKLRALNQVLDGKTVLITDDDVRNIFSLSKALEQYNMTVLTALDGKDALQKLTDNPGVDVVLLDMMMPEMDGYETARKIREHYVWRNLPVIAVTAKAMTGDREKCIEAGASDYITKPVDIDQLVSLLRVWLYD